jgi:hypothetical protein
VSLFAILKCSTPKTNKIVEIHTPPIELGDNSYYYNNIFIEGDSVVLSDVEFNGSFGDFSKEKILKTWHCPDINIRKEISLATIDFHQQPGELKMLHLAKGMSNMKYVVNANFEKHIKIKNKTIIKFKK